MESLPLPIEIIDHIICFTDLHTAIILGNEYAIKKLYNPRFHSTYWAAGKDIEILKYLISIGKKPTHHLMESAACKGRLEVLKYLHSIGIGCLFNAMDVAARKGYLEVVKFLHSIGTKHSLRAIKFASHIEIADFLKGKSNYHILGVDDLPSLCSGSCCL